jgi:hypothetical protein
MNARCTIWIILTTTEPKDANIKSEDAQENGERIGFVSIDGPAYSWADVRSSFKTLSNAQMRRCEFLPNAHLLPRLLRFFINSRLVFGRGLLIYFPEMCFPLKPLTAGTLAFCRFMREQLDHR